MLRLKKNLLVGFASLYMIILSSCNNLERITSQYKQEVEFPAIAIKDVNIIDVERDSVLKNQTLLIQNGLIKDYGTTQRIKIPENCFVVDATGKYLMPGLIDMHVHISDDGDMLKFLKYGVTTVRNMSDVPWWTKLLGFSDILSLKQKQKQNKVFGPSIYTCGYTLDGENRVSPMNKRMTSLEDVRKEIAREIEKGYDFIKLYDNLSLEVYKEIINQANDYKVPVVGHVPYSVGIKSILEDHVETIEHLTGYIDNNQADYIIDSDSTEFYIQKTKQSGVYNCPTLVIWDNLPPEDKFNVLQRDNEFKFVPWQVRWLWKTSFPYYYKISFADKENYSRQMKKITMEFVNKLYRADCPMLIGTDANVIGTYVGYSTLREMELFSEAGIPNNEALRCATLNAAKALHKEDEIGSIKIGKKANLILLQANPLINIKNIESLEGVFLNQNYFTQSLLNKLVDRYYKIDITN